MTHVRISRLSAVLVVGALALTACGQREGVHVEGNTGEVLARGGDGFATAAPTDGAAAAPGPAQTESGPAAAQPGTQNQGQTGAGANTQGGGTTGGGGDGGGGGDQNTGTGGGGGGGGQLQVTGSDRTGVTDEKITVSFHAPVTGAAPLPAEAFERARDLYWRYQAEQGRTFLGRPQVQVNFNDDKYDPANARQVCRQQAAEAFIVAGGGGTDQIQACGQLAGVDQFPYFSAGVTEAGLENNPWYFAASMTYRQQGVLLAQYIKKNFPGQRFGAIITQTQNFDDAVQGFEAGIQQAGAGNDYGGTLRHTKNDSSWYNQFGDRLANDGVEVLYLLTSPVDYIQFAQQNAGRGFQYVGVGVSMGLNAVLGSGCPDVDKGIFFSPFPGLDWARQNVPEYFQAWRDFQIDSRERPGDMDLGLALWGINLQLDLLFQRYEQTFGTDLTREDFRALVEGGGPLDSGIFPEVEYSQNDHFGGKSVHVLQADCSKGEYKTLATFATGF